VIAELCRTLLGTWDEAGNPVRGDLERELERLDVALDGTLTPSTPSSTPQPLSTGREG